MRNCRPIRLFALCVVAGGCSFARAEVPDDSVARLEAQLAVQAARLDTLTRQVAAYRSQEEGVRTDLLREQIREVLAEPGFRDSLVPTSTQTGYDKGFFIRSSDRKFLMRFNLRVQFRWTHYAVGSRNRYQSPDLQRHDRTGFDVSRIYFAISGHAYHPDLTYALIVDGSEYRVYDFGVLHGWINYRVVDAFQIRAGIMRVSGTRANVDTATMQFVETPIMEEAYTFHRGLGVRVWGLLKGPGEVEGQYRFDVLNTLANPNTRTITTDEEQLARGHDNNPAIVFRTVWSLLGSHCEFPEQRIPYSAASCDLAYHTQPALNVGFHYAFNEDYRDGSLSLAVARHSRWHDGGFALVTAEGMQIQQFGVDAGFMYRGFSTTAEYVLRLLDVRNAASPPYSPLYLLTGDGSTTTQHAAYVQCGYFLPIPGFEQKVELVGRVGWMHVGTGGQNSAWEYTGGVNYYIQGHRLKLQTDVTHITEAPFAFSTNSLANVNDDALIWRVQLQFAF